MPSDEHDGVVAVRGVGVLGGEDAVRNHPVLARQPPRRRLLGHRRHGDPRVEAVHEEAPEVQRGSHPLELAVCVVRRDNRASRERDRGDAHRRRHRLVHMDDVELLLVEDAPDPPDRPRGEDDVRKRPVRRHDDRPADRDDPLGERAVASAARVQEARELPRRVVPHQDLHVVPAPPQGVGLVLRVLDHPSPVRP